MNQYLKAAVDRYERLNKGEKTYLIAPISKIDAEIIVEIVELFKKLNKMNVVEILKNYKFHKDEEIRDALLDANTNFKNESSTSDDEQKEALSAFTTKRDFVQIGDERIFIGMINSWSKGERFCRKRGSMVYSIILNRFEKDLQLTKVPMYANHTFDFDDMDERDEAFDKLDDLLTSSGKINIWKV